MFLSAPLASAADNTDVHAFTAPDAIGTVTFAGLADEAFFVDLGAVFDGVSARDALDTATIGFREDPPDDLAVDASASAPLFGGLTQEIEFCRTFDRLGPGMRTLNFQSKPQVSLSDFVIDPGWS